MGYRISKKKERAGARSTKKNNGKKTKSLHPLIVMGKNIASQSGCMPWNFTKKKEEEMSAEKAKDFKDHGYWAHFAFHFYDTS